MPENLVRIFWDISSCYSIWFLCSIEFLMHLCVRRLVYICMMAGICFKHYECFMKGTIPQDLFVSVFDVHVHYTLPIAGWCFWLHLYDGCIHMLRWYAFQEIQNVLLIEIWYDLREGYKSWDMKMFLVGQSVFGSLLVVKMLLLMCFSFFSRLHLWFIFQWRWL